METTGKDGYLSKLSRRKMEGGRNWNFLKEYTEAERKGLARRMRIGFPGNVPVVIARAKGCKVGAFGELRVGVPGNLTLLQLHVLLRPRLGLTAKDSMVFFVGGNNNTLVPPTASIAALYHAHAHTDNFLYVTFRDEVAYG